MGTQFKTWNFLKFAQSYAESAEKLQAESGLSLKKQTVADNIDLLTILQVTVLTWS